MRTVRVFCLIFAATVLFSLLTSYKPRGVQGSYESSSNSSSSALKPLIILDAGHGGTDEGAKVPGFIEKKAALTTVYLVKKHLEAIGYRVMLTRSRDVFLSLQRRVSIANKAKSSLFVSVHFNSSPSVEAKGIEIFYFDTKELWRAKASKRLAQCVLKHVIGHTEAASRGIKKGNFYVIRETGMPSVLVEGGFITNRQERGLLRDKAYLDKLALGIAQGIDQYMH